MSEAPSIVETTPEKVEEVAEVVVCKELEMQDNYNVSDQIHKAREAYKKHAMLEDPPNKLELIGWYIYGLCSYFIQTFLLPILFPLIITQIASPSSDLPPTPTYTSRGVACEEKEMDLYQRLIKHSITVKSYHLSPLQWTSISWAAGILVSFPILMYSSHHLDHTAYQPLILGVAVIAGGFFCLLTGFFRTAWLFPLYILGIVVASAVGSATHCRHLGLMLRGVTAHATGKNYFQQRRAMASLHSSYVTAAGSVGAAVIAAFTYHMLRRSDNFTSLWVVSIFSGFKWFLGVCHAIFANRPGNAPSMQSLAHIFSIFSYPHALGSLISVFLSSFSSMCIFASGTLYVVGYLCIKPVFLLALWMIFFMFPMIALPLLRPVQRALHDDAVRMQLLGFFLSAATSGTGFYFRDCEWRRLHILLIAALQSTATGVLHAFGRVLLLHCSPAGREGAFSAWYAWTAATGTYGGFAVASAFTDDVRTTFGVSFWAIIAGVFVLIFGNVSDVSGATAAGHVSEEEGEVVSPVHGSDRVGEGRVV